MAELAFTRRGVGAPIVLLHALSSSRYSFDPIIPALARHFDVIAIDLPGFGDSEPFSASVEPTPAALAAVVAEELDHLGVRSAHLVGNSLGGWVALELAAIHPAASVSCSRRQDCGAGIRPCATESVSEPRDGWPVMQLDPFPVFWTIAWYVAWFWARLTADLCT
jgi:pimeloyl-ACP methyl ester carboxylesterase